MTSLDQHVLMNMQEAVDRTGHIVAGSVDLDKSIDFVKSCFNIRHYRKCVPGLTAPLTRLLIF